jgi:hypothetical protein
MTISGHLSPAQNGVKMYNHSKKPFKNPQSHLKNAAHGVLFVTSNPLSGYENAF